MTEKFLRVNNREVFKELTTEESPVTEEEKKEVLASLIDYIERSWPSDRQPLNGGNKT